MLGDVIGFFGSIASAYFFSMSGDLFRKVPSLLSVSLIMLFSSLIMIVYGTMLFANDFTLSLDPKTGAFGFLNS